MAVEKAGAPMVVANGYNGQVELWINSVRITRKGFVAWGTNRAEKEIPLANIATVEFHPCTFLSWGYIQFIFPGGQQTKAARFGLDRGITDENKVLFSKGQQPNFERFRDALQMELIRSVAGKNSTEVPSKFDELEKLANLRNKGILTEEEFQREKRKLLE
jgi:hypothetical protein